eukprot:CAMPEP_0115844058 /NCGR_PEP_ID=MMETSP0287-20121206/8635_1 /TAXON_ID=412157 /ORGANISM="Chrysochromulina rotalis, Strain UIO044" /LENGTH=108 /DNA_ID=CAMNT_0003297777 /DNA_START=1037 /DNA_END=1363 /DNA_ORIENTATION=+
MLLEAWRDASVQVPVAVVIFSAPPAQGIIECVHRRVTHDQHAATSKRLTEVLQAECAAARLVAVLVAQALHLLTLRAIMAIRISSLSCAQHLPRAMPKLILRADSSWP